MPEYDADYTFSPKSLTWTKVVRKTHLSEVRLDPPEGQ